ncbi:MAG: hypothetical protein ACRD96_16280, partial [Bryobacteraceae bacterium]
VASWDSLPAALIPLSVVLDGSITLDRFVPALSEGLGVPPYYVIEKDSHFYSIYPVAQPVLLSPLYAPFRLLRAARPETLILAARVTEKLLAGAIAAASVALLYLLLARLGPRALPATLLYAFATPVWSTAGQALWQHTGGVLLHVLTLLALERGRFGLAGAWSGLAVAVRPTNALIALAVACHARKASFLPGPIVCGILAAAYNVWLFGDMRGGYAWSPLVWDAREAIAGVLVSPSRGLFVYSPVLLGSVAGAWLGRGRPLVSLSAWCALAHLAVICLWHAWWGGAAWGPRLTTEMMPFLAVLMLPALEFLWWRRSAAVLFVWSAAMQFIGAFCYPRGGWDTAPVEVGQRPERLWDWRDNPIRRTVAGGLVLEPHQVAWEAIVRGPAAARRKMDELSLRGF